MSQRWWGFGVVLFTVVIIVIVLRLEQVKHLMPCNLCILQRLAFLSAGIGGIWLWLLPVHRWSRLLGSIWLMLSSLTGGAIAMRQIWLQHLPADQVPACGPGFQYLFANFPVHNALLLLLSGDGNCAAVDWRLLGFSIAVWSCLGFVLLFSVGLKVVLKK